MVWINKLKYALGTAAFLGAALGVSSLLSLDDKLRNEVTDLISDARRISAGEDRIWSLQEKRIFLDENGLRDVVMQEGEDIYFRMWLENRTGRFGGMDAGVNVFTGYNLENDGGFLYGSTARSGTKIGQISADQLRDYVRKHQNR